MAPVRNSASTHAPQGPRAIRVRDVLTQAFAPLKMDIQDESHRHAHHVAMVRGPEAGASETHFRILLVSAAFDGVGRVARHRMVNDALKAEFDTGLHALALTLRTPEEDAKIS